jgi:hypothetical protein
MTEMIERARLAVIEVIQSSDLPAGTYIDSERIVRAVLEAIREPTPDMIEQFEGHKNQDAASFYWGWMIGAALGVRECP